jgi:hypothetical protein
MSKSSETETVGYKRPPIKTQFKPGNSGNPRGRPRKSKVNMGQSLSEALDAKILVTSFQKAHRKSIRAFLPKSRRSIEPPQETPHRCRKLSTLRGSSE